MRHTTQHLVHTLGRSFIISGLANHPSNRQRVKYMRDLFKSGSQV